MHLALTGLFQAKWSETIHEEWIRNLLAERPDLTREQLERTRSLMNVHVRDGLVEGYESLIDQIELPDPGDRHVVAAAIVANANRIITFNLKDFPRPRLAAHKLEAQHPDAFVMDLFERDSEVIYAAVRKHRTSLKHPAKSVPEYLTIIERQGLSRTVAHLRSQSRLLE